MFHDAAFGNVVAILLVAEAWEFVDVSRMAGVGWLVSGSHFPWRGLQTLSSLEFVVVDSPSFCGIVSWRSISQTWTSEEKDTRLKKKKNHYVNVSVCWSKIEKNMKDHMSEGKSLLEFLHVHTCICSSIRNEGRTHMSVWKHSSIPSSFFAREVKLSSSSLNANIKIAKSRL